MTIPRDYGSAVTELSVCLTSVGLVDRHDLAPITVHGRAPALNAIAETLTGAAIAPGGFGVAGQALWGRPSADELVVVAPPVAAPRTLDLLHHEQLRVPGLTIADRTGGLTTIGVLGPATPRLLEALGVVAADALREAAPCFEASVGGSTTTWFLRSDRAALTVARREDAASVWRAIESAGRPFGLGWAGREALDRFELLERARARPALRGVL